MQWPKEKDKTPYNDPQNTTQKTEDRATRTPLNIGDEVRCCWNQCLYAKKKSCPLIKLRYLYLRWY